MPAACDLVLLDLTANQTQPADPYTVLAKEVKRQGGHGIMFHICGTIIACTSVRSPRAWSVSPDLLAPAAVVYCGHLRQVEPDSR